MSYQQALDALGIEPPSPANTTYCKNTAKHTAKCSNAVTPPPPPTWQSKAAEFLALSQEYLFIPTDGIIQNLYFKRRLGPDTCKALGIGYNEKDLYPFAREWGIEIPEQPNKKIRLPKGIVIASKWQNQIVSVYVHFDEPEPLKDSQGRPILDKEGNPVTRKGHCIKGAGNKPFIAGTEGQPLVLVESALDAALIWQASFGTLTALAFCGVGSNNLEQHYIDFINNAPLVMAILDREKNKAGVKAGATWAKQFPKVLPPSNCFYVPEGKDIGEMHHKALCFLDERIPLASDYLKIILSKASRAEKGNAIAV